MTNSLNSKNKVEKEASLSWPSSYHLIIIFQNNIFVQEKNIISGRYPEHLEGQSEKILLWQASLLFGLPVI